MSLNMNYKDRLSQNKKQTKEQETSQVARKMTQQLRVLAAVLADLSSVSSSHIRQLTTACKSSFRRSDPHLLASTGTCTWRADTQTHPHPHIQRQRHMDTRIHTHTHKHACVHNTGTHTHTINLSKRLCIDFFLSWSPE